MFDVQSPTSPDLHFIWVEDWIAIYHVVEYDADCDEFNVVKVLKFDVETWEKN